jgi:GNAT superfamily N-acetyltransferase
VRWTCSPSSAALAMPESAVRILGTPFSPAQLAEIARMHRSEVGEGFLSSLGEPVLRLLYKHIASSRYCRLFVAYAEPEGGEPLGYICGTSNTSALYHEFISRRWRIALPMLVPKLMSPSRILRIVETLLYPRNASADLPPAEIINFVVIPAARGAGVAAALFGSLMQWFEAQGSSAVKIVTGDQQLRAHGFYEKVGAEFCGRTSIHRGRWSWIYVFPLGYNTPGGGRGLTGRPAGFDE